MKKITFAVPPWRQQLHVLEGLLKPLREVAIKMKIKVASDSNYQVFFGESEAIHKQMENIVVPALEALCGAESLDKDKMTPSEIGQMAERFAKQTVLLRHHISSARSAATRFNGILGIVDPVKK